MQRTAAPGPAPELVVPVVPAPVRAERGVGRWSPADEVVVTLTGAGSGNEALTTFAARMVGDAFGRNVSVRPGGTAARDVIHLRLDPGSGGAESYRLTVTDRGADITAPDDAGLFYGLQTLRQLLEAEMPASGGPASSIPAVTITDAPRFAWRGLHLDVARHLYPVDFIKGYIDLMARYKLNTFHWHLTDDQGWRVEIRKYPRLTQIGGCRKETMVARNFRPYVGDGVPYCGFYTQEQIRDVVAYAAARHVTVVPEIEMPGHAKAALAAYPELACTPGPFEVWTMWGVDEDIFCPSERTFGFIEDVLTEVMELFPGRYIHVGGDEVPKTRWRASPVAQEVMRREGLRTEEELQSWFIRRVERFVASRGRQLVGWDEILEGGLPPGATVMSWRGTAGGIAAARAGHDVVMSPSSHLYLDYRQGPQSYEPIGQGGLVTLARVHAYEPIPTELTAAESRHVLGAQGNVWTEYMRTPEMVEYYAYPRVLALAEVVWSPKETRDWNDFTRRLPFALRTLDRMRVNYRVPEVEGIDGDRLTLDDRVTVSLRSLVADAVIRYTIDGSEPTATSARYTAPVTLTLVNDSARLAARVFAANGRVSAPRAATFTRTTYLEPASIAASALAPGLRYRYSEATVRTVRAIDTLRAVREGTVSAIGRRGDERPERYALRLSGFIRVPADGMYEFALASDDGSSLEIGGRIVVNHDGAHAAEEKVGMVALRAGAHPVVVRYFQGGGGADLWLRYRVSGGEWREVPREWWAHAR